MSTPAAAYVRRSVTTAGYGRGRRPEPGDAGPAPSLRPADAGRGCVRDEDLAGPRADDFLHAFGAAPFRGEHEQRSPLGTAEHRREAGTVELDRVERPRHPRGYGRSR